LAEFFRGGTEFSFSGDDSDRDALWVGRPAFAKTTASQGRMSQNALNSQPSRRGIAFAAVSPLRQTTGRNPSLRFSARTSPKRTFRAGNKGRRLFFTAHFI
jgi:hypothetical protein